MKPKTHRKWPTDFGDCTDDGRSAHYVTTDGFMFSECDLNGEGVGCGVETGDCNYDGSWIEYEDDVLAHPIDDVGSSYGAGYANGKGFG